jgi:hypothetical protein
MITSTDNNYTGSLTAALTITAKLLTATVNNTTEVYTGQPITAKVINDTTIIGTYSGNFWVSGTEIGNYETTIIGILNYTGSIKGILTIIAAANPPSEPVPLVIITGEHLFNSGIQSVTKQLSTPTDGTEYTISYSWIIEAADINTLLDGKDSSTIDIHTNFNNSPETVVRVTINSNTRMVLPGSYTSSVKDIYLNFKMGRTDTTTSISVPFQFSYSTSPK